MQFDPRVVVFFHFGVILALKGVRDLDEINVYFQAAEK